MRNWALSATDTEKLNRLAALIEEQLGFQLFETIEGCKRELSIQESSRFQFEYPDISLDFSIGQSNFKNAVSPDVEKIFDCMDETLKTAGLKNADIDLVYATGGTSKMELIQKGLEQRFSSERVMKNRFFHSVIEGLVERTRELL
jgi:hypothetical chaperone protein